MDDALEDDLRQLVVRFRSQADIFPDGKARRVGHYCADELEALLEEREANR